jgi:hypothetical protein
METKHTSQPVTDKLCDRFTRPAKGGKSNVVLLDFSHLKRFYILNVSLFKRAEFAKQELKGRKKSSQKVFEQHKEITKLV